MKSLITMTSAILLAATAAPAVAQSVADPPRMVVNYTDLNLTTPAGRAALQHRLDNAVDQVCASRPDVRELGKQAAYESCRKQAWDSIRPQLAQQQFAEVEIRGNR